MVKNLNIAAEQKYSELGHARALFNCFKIHIPTYNTAQFLIVIGTVLNYNQRTSIGLFLLTFVWTINYRL